MDKEKLDCRLMRCMDEELCERICYCHSKIDHAQDYFWFLSNDMMPALRRAIDGPDEEVKPILRSLLMRAARTI